MMDHNELEDGGAKELPEQTPPMEEARPAWPGRVEPSPASPEASLGQSDASPPEGPDLPENFNLSGELPPIREAAPYPSAPPAGYPGNAAPPAGYPGNAAPPAGYPSQMAQPDWSGQSNAYEQPNPWGQPAPPTPPPSAQWAFHDYGPVGGGKPPKPPKPPKSSKPPKPPKGKRVAAPDGGEEPDPSDRKKKKPAGSGNGYKALAILMCVLFVLSTGGFGTYVWYDLNREAAPPASTQPGGSQPTLDIQATPNEDTLPKGEEDAGQAGKLTGNQIHQAVEPAVVGVVGYLKSPIGTTMVSQGSGVIISEDGYIVTNNHVISDERSGAAYDRVEVIVSNGDHYEAVIKGRDQDSDLAVLKINATGLKAAVFGDSDKVKVGDRAFVIGNPSGLEFAGSLTGGYISAVHRFVEVQNIGSKVEFIQTDAAINPGNSGGALVNEYGQVIGITSAKLVEEAYEGMGFAIPINNAKPIIDSLIKNGWVRGRVQIGIQYLGMTEIDSQLNGIPRGLRVASVNDNSDAKAKGIRVGDIIYQMDGKDVYDSDTIADVLAGKVPGDTVKLSVFRVGSDDKAQRFEVDVVLQEKVPDDVSSPQ